MGCWEVEDQAFDWAHDEEGKGLSIYAQDIVDLLTYSMRVGEIGQLIEDNNRLLGLIRFLRTSGQFEQAIMMLNRRRGEAGSGHGNGAALVPFPDR
jgi:hypothetical protein